MQKRKPIATKIKPCCNNKELDTLSIFRYHLTGSSSAIRSVSWVAQQKIHKVQHWNNEHATKFHQVNKQTRNKRSNKIEARRNNDPFIVQQKITLVQQAMKKNSATNQYLYCNKNKTLVQQIKIPTTTIRNPTAANTSCGNIWEDMLQQKKITFMKQLWKMLRQFRKCLQQA